ncbi:MAG: hypothetical protein OEY52_04310 [Gammaproteobacteria bacterium]|nr:hypothetical protein [Gammaproteobacteria bacterium]
MREKELDNINVAIASHEQSQRLYLRMAMEANGLSVVLNDSLSKEFIQKLQKANPDAILLDMHDDEHHEDLIDELLDSVDVPILFNDVTGLTINEPSSLSLWYGKLMRKIAALTGRGIRDYNQFDRSYESLVGEIPPQLYDKSQGELAKRVWVLGSSLGGPEALKKFLNRLPADLPVAFILAQHLGANFVTLLASQLNQTSAFEVLPPIDGHVLRHGQVVVAPVGQRITINPIGAIKLKPLDEDSPYTPSIDKVLTDMATRYKSHSGAIIFSGMCDDGKYGCQVMKQYDGQIWAQDADSCVISSMPDSVRDTGVVSYSNGPEQLADKLVKQFQFDLVDS